MKLTANFRLRKPDGTDPVDVQDFNDNADVIDTELAKKMDKSGTGSDLTTVFSQAASRTNVTSGEKLSVSLGKVMKWFTDLKAVAFTGSYADLTNKPTIPSGPAASLGVANNCTTSDAGYVLDARQGKVLMEKSSEISSNLGNVKIIPEGSGAGVKYYAQLGADAASKKLLGKSLILLGTASSYNLKNLCPNDYQNLTVNSFVMDLVQINISADKGGQAKDGEIRNVTNLLSKAYNNETGIFSYVLPNKKTKVYGFVPSNDAYGSSTSATVNLRVYVLI